MQLGRAYYYYYLHAVGMSTAEVSHAVILTVALASTLPSAAKCPTSR